MASHGRDERSEAWRIATCSAAPVVIPAVVYWRLVASLRLPSVPPQIERSLRLGAVRLGVCVALVGLGLSVVTCLFIAWRRRQNVGALLSALSDVALLIAFVLSPWAAIKLANGTSAGVMSMWVGPGALTRSLPAIYAAVAGLLYLSVRRRSSVVEPAA